MFQQKLQRCPYDCASNHNDSDVFDQQITIENSHFIIDSQINVCQLKWKLACDMIKNYRSISLAIINLDTQSIQKDYPILSHEFIEAVTLEFEERIQTSNRKYLDDIFNYLQKAANLKSLNLSFKNKNIYPNKIATSLLGTNFQAIKGSLAQIQQLSINLSDYDQKELEFLPLELSLIDPSKREGSLKMVEFILLGRPTIYQDTYKSISRIVEYNRNSIRSVSFSLKVMGSNHNSLVTLSESFSKMTYLNEIILNILGSTGTLDSNLLFEGISKGYQKNTSQSGSQSISLHFSRYLINDGLKLGSCLLNFSNVKFQSNLSISAATEIGKALGNSQRLQSLEIGSQTQELGHLLVQFFSCRGSLKDLIIRFEGDNQKILPEYLNKQFKTNKSIQKITVEIEEIDFLSLSNFMNIFSETKTTSKLLHLGISIDKFKGMCSEISELLKSISKLTMLQSLKIFIKEIELINEIKSEDIFLPLNSLKDLECISFDFGYKCDFLYKEQFFIKLLSGLIWHPRVRAVEFPQYQNLRKVQKIANKFKSEVESIMANTIGFYKILSPLLEFHPKRHLEDFYL